MNTEITTFLDNQYTLIAPTNRLSRTLLNQYAASQIEQGKTVWETPNCLPWSAWCRRQWREIVFQKELSTLALNSYQQQWLWQQIIQASPVAKTLLQTIQTASQASQAYALCKAWCIPVFPDATYLNDDAYAFKSWVLEYEKRLKESDWIDDANLPDSLTEQINKQKDCDERIALLGFDDITPQQQKLIDALKSKGAEVVEITPDKRNKTVSVGAFADTRAEINSAANWARQILIDEPTASIGIVTPGLKPQRQAFVYGFDEVLNTEQLLGHDEKHKPYTISLGRPLAHYPLIHTALTILSLGKRKIPLNGLSSLLRSAFIKGANHERIERANFDARLREIGEQTLSLTTVFSIETHHCNEHQQCHEFIENLKAFDIHYLSCSKKQTMHAWAKTFSDLLKQFSWPGERTPNSDEYQTIAAWQDALTQFATLDNVLKPVNYTTALGQLTRIINDISFQPETIETPIQILGTTGAAGMQFDYLWIMGLHDQVWPQVLQPNPFIPLNLQREVKLPHASADKQLALTRQLTDNLVQSARIVVMSYPQHDGDRSLRASPIIQPFIENSTALNIHYQTDYKKQVLDSQQLEKFIDDTAPAIAKGQSVSGGTAIFKDQAACPFRSFARHRLYAKGLETTGIGLSPAERGTLVHNALQYLWQRLKDSDNLAQRSDEELVKTINTAVIQAIKQQIKQQPETFTERFTQLEQQRLVQLLGEWLEIEKDRTAFKVKTTEQWHTVTFNDFKIHLRIDRIDELANGRLIIIDYKTGQARISDWDTDRPNDPQLPFYAITSQGEIAALVFARVKRGVLQFVGVAKDDDLIPRVKPDPEKQWTDMITDWETVLIQLANEFREGKAAVTPKDIYACRYCDLHAFCRIHERIDAHEAYEQEIMINE